MSLIADALNACSVIFIGYARRRCRRSTPTHLTGARALISLLGERRM
jgi:hypothetical protein